MARSKKSSEKIISEASALDVEGEEPLLAQQRHRIVTEYVKTVPVNDDVDGDDDTIDDDDKAESSDPATDDPIEKLLREIGASHSNWTLVVDRLPNYHRDGMSGSRVKFIRCGVFALTPDMLQGEAYIEEIQTRWARPGKPNDFRLCVRRDGKIYAYLPVLTLEPPEPEVLAKVMANEQTQVNFIQQPPDNSLDAFLKQAEKFAKLRSVLGWEPPAQQAAQQNPAQQPLTTEAALLHLVSSDESLMEKAVNGLSKLFRRTEDGAREVGLLDIAFEAIKQNTLPQLVREFRAMLRDGAQLNGQTQTPASALPQGAGPDHQGNQLWAGAQTQGQPQGAPGDGQTSSAGIPADNNRGDSLPPHIQLLNFAIHSCANNAAIDATADWIDSFVYINPNMGPFINAFLTMTPTEALEWLVKAAPQAQPIVAAPHAQRWVEALQTALREEEGTNESEGSAGRVAGDS
jgi:hypothetical protein